MDIQKSRDKERKGYGTPVKVSVVELWGESHTKETCGNRH
tara:strand:+ start:62 stop:181 length:120 start_codon:yes stop_codon:yes gene_type:complete